MVDLKHGFVPCALLLVALAVTTIASAPASAFLPSGQQSEPEDAPEQETPTGTATAAARLTAAVELYESAPKGAKEARARTDRYKTCEELFWAIQDDFPDTPESLTALYYGSQCQRRTKMTEQAVEGFEQFLEEARGHEKIPEARYSLGACRLSLRQYPAAYSLMDWLIREHPGHSWVPEALYNCAVALRQLGRFDEAGALLDRLLEEFPDDSRISRVPRLRKSLRPPAERLVELERALSKEIAALRETPYKERSKAQKKVNAVLTRIGAVHSKEAVQFLLRVFQEHKDPTKGAAITPALTAGNAEVAEYFLEHLEDGQPALRARIMNAMKARHFDGVSIDPVVKCASHGNAAVSIAALRLLGRIGTVDAVKTLVQSLPREETQNRTVAARQSQIRDALRTVRDRDALLYLAQEVLVNRKVPLEVRRVVADALGSSRSLIAATELIQTLQDRDPELARASVSSLGRLRAHHGTPMIIEQMEMRKRDPEFLRSAVHALARLRPVQAEEFLLELSRGPYPALIPAVIRVVGKIDSDACFERITQALRDPSWRVRSAALEVAGNYPRKELVEVLMDRLDKEDGPRRLPLFQLLITLTGVDHGPDVEAWREYWEAMGAGFVVHRKGAAPSQGKTYVKKDADPTKARTPRYFGVEIISKRLVFIVDVSGSMSGPVIVPKGDGTNTTEKKMELARQELLGALPALQRGTRFNLIRFSSAFSSYKKKLVSFNKKTLSGALKFVKGLQPGGGTNIYDTLEHALKLGDIDTIYFLSDGEPSAGKHTQTSRILEEVAKLNNSAQVIIHTVSLGYESEFLRKLAAENRGEYVVAGANRPEKENKDDDDS